MELKSRAREQSRASCRHTGAGRAGNELFYFAGEFATNCGVSFHQFAALVIRKRVPIALLAASFAHIIEAYYRPIGQRRINALLPIMLHPLAKGFHRFSELL